MEKGRLWGSCLCIILCIQMSMKAECGLVDITYLENAVARGAVCLDGSPAVGSPAAYNFEPGFGEGKNSWFIKLLGGGWCNNVTACLRRKNSYLGSSTKMDRFANFTGIFSNSPDINPDFYNWNKIRIRYCDGASFSADVEEVDHEIGLHFRGRRIFFAIIDDLLKGGMRNAENVLFSGCSAGAVGTILHCDSLRALLPMHTRVKCLSDAGFFINAKDISGQPTIQNFYSEVVQTHKLEKFLPSYCTSKMNPELCFFPENVVPGIQTPLFILNAGYDLWQIQNILVPNNTDSQGLWSKCKYNLTDCSTDQLKTLEDFRLQFLKALGGPNYPPSRGLFINSCFRHCQSEFTQIWSFQGLLSNTSIAKAVGDWYYDRNIFQHIDCPYPCDNTC